MKNNWIILNKEHLTTYLHVSQLAAFEKFGKKGFVSEILEDVALRVRAEVHAFESNFLDDNVQAIPPELKSSACYLAIEALHGHVPGLSLSKEQVDNAKHAREFLKRVAKGQVSISMPENFTHDHIGYASKARMRAIRKQKGLNKDQLKGL